MTDAMFSPPRRNAFNLVGTLEHKDLPSVLVNSMSVAVSDERTFEEFESAVADEAKRLVRSLFEIAKGL